jgi:hypothetical protein
MDQQMYRELTVPVVQKVLDATVHLTDLTLCQNILLGFEGLRLFLLKDFVPGGPNKSTEGVPFVDVFVKGRYSAYIAFHENLAAPMPEEIPGLGYIREVNEAPDAFYQELADDITNWLVNKVMPAPDTTLH